MSAQPELPGMPEETPLGQAAQRFVAVKETIAEAKLRSADIEKEILEQMKLDGTKHFKVSVAGENYEFELVASDEHVRCVKITKTIKKSDSNQSAEAKPAEPAAV